MSENPKMNFLFYLHPISDYYANYVLDKKIDFRWMLNVGALMVTWQLIFSFH